MLTSRTLLGGGLVLAAGLAAVALRTPIEEPRAEPAPVPLVSCGSWRAETVSQRVTTAGRFWWDTTEGRRPTPTELADLVATIDGMCGTTS